MIIDSECVVLQGNLSVTHNDSGTVTFNRPITRATFCLTMSGTGLLLLSAANTHSGATTGNDPTPGIGSVKLTLPRSEPAKSTRLKVTVQ